VTTRPGTRSGDVAGRAVAPDVVRGIDHVQILMPPGSEDAARSFFGGLLGLQEVPKPEALAGRGGVWFAVGPHQLHVSSEENFAPAPRAHPAFLVEDLDALRRRLEQASVPMRDDVPVDGKRRFHVSDPFGNRIELMEAAA
jgi:catechol 2,3-dioxygenase-like lactoylglutathione lyase family enzyme